LSLAHTRGRGRGRGKPSIPFHWRWGQWPMGSYVGWHLGSQSHDDDDDDDMLLTLGNIARGTKGTSRSLA